MDAMTRLATCSVCGTAFEPEPWQHDRGRMLCAEHLGDSTYKDPRDSPEARVLRDEILASHPPCHWCGAPATTIDHWPKSIQAGGATTRDNVVPACAPCNKSRGPRSGPPQGILDRISTEGVHAQAPGVTEEQLLKTMRQFKRLT